MWHVMISVLVYVVRPKIWDMGVFWSCRLIELDEAVEALDAAMEYKNDAIHSRKEELRHSTILRQVSWRLLQRALSLSTR